MRRRTTSPRAPRTSGYTLVELLVSVSLLGLILGSISMAVVASQRAHDERATLSELETAAHRTVDRIALELSEAGRSTLVPFPSAPSGTSSLLFQRNQGFVQGAIVWGTARRIQVELLADERDDGLDNNGNGLIDEGHIVWIEDPGGASERRLVYGSWVREYLEGELPNGADDNGNGLVDERGLSVVMNGDTLAVRVTVERRDKQGRLLTRTVGTSVKLWN